MRKVINYILYIQSPQSKSTEEGDLWDGADVTNWYLLSFMLPKTNLLAETVNNYIVYTVAKYFTSSTYAFSRYPSAHFIEVTFLDLFLRSAEKRCVPDPSCHSPPQVAPGCRAPGYSSDQWSVLALELLALRCGDADRNE